MVNQVGACESGDDNVYTNQSCKWVASDPKVVTFYNDQELTNDKVELPPRAQLVSKQYRLLAVILINLKLLIFIDTVN